jgi:hypothetical protein
VRRLIVVPRSAHVRVAIALIALIAGACTSKERAPDSARADSGAGAAQPANTLATLPPSAATLPGQLTKPIDQYTGDEFYDLVQRLKWGGGADRSRACKGDAGCGGTNPSKETTVRVDAVDGQDSLSATGVPTNGVVAIRALNKGSQIEERYGFKPDRKLEYYLVVLPSNGNTSSWRLEELDTTAGARKHSSVGTGAFKPCNHPFQPKRVNRANFYNCADSHMTDSVQKSGMVMFDPKTDPLWTECAQGCCLADG